MAKGYAAKNNTGVLLDTVSSTERAAKVNWLCAHDGILVLNSASDSEIYLKFKARATVKRVTIVEVIISIAESAMSRPAPPKEAE